MRQCATSSQSAPIRIESQFSTTSLGATRGYPTVRCTQGCYDAAVAYGTPFISGKDSLNNEYTGVDGRKHTIPGTLVISSLGIVPDVSKTVTSAFKAAGNNVYVIGITGNHLGGSALARWAGHNGGHAPAPTPTALFGYRALHHAIAAGLVESCHDVSEGGIAVALAEMAIGGRIGVAVSIDALPRRGAISSTIAMFSESLGRLVIEVDPMHRAEFEQAMDGYPTELIGQTTDDAAIRITAADIAIEASLDRATNSWRGGTT